MKTDETDATPHQARDLTGVITRIRHVLAPGIRGELPWEILPMAQVEILHQLDNTAGMRVSDIAYRHRLALSTVSTLAKALTEAGLITRRQDPVDRRAVLLQITEDGRLALSRWMSLTEQFMSSALARLDDATLDSLRSAVPALATLAGALEASYDETFIEHRTAAQSGSWQSTWVAQ